MRLEESCARGEMRDDSSESWGCLGYCSGDLGMSADGSDEGRDGLTLGAMMGRSDSRERRDMFLYMEAGFEVCEDFVVKSRSVRDGESGREDGGHCTTSRPGKCRFDGEQRQLTHPESQDVKERSSGVEAEEEW